MFNEIRTTQAALYLLHKGGGSFDHYFLIKMLYYTDRRSLITIGRTLTGDRMVSMQYGPVLSIVKDLTDKDQSSVLQANPYWTQHIRPRTPETGHTVIAVDEVKPDQLTSRELQILDESFELVYTTLEHDFNKVCKYFEDLPEWDPNAKEKKTSIPIDTHKILKSAGKTEDRIAEIISMQNMDDFITDITEHKTA